MYTYRAKLIKVVDGDTVDLSVDLGFDVSFNARFRLAGINAPESRTTDLEEKARGIAAKEWLLAQLKDQKFTVRTHREDAQEKYGRYLADIFLDVDHHSPKSLNQIMIDEGYAVSYFGSKR